MNSDEAKKLVSEWTKSGGGLNRFLEQLDALGKENDQLRAKLKWFERWRDEVRKVTRAINDNCSDGDPFDAAAERLRTWERENPKPGAAT